MGQGFSQGNAVWVQTEKPTYFDGDLMLVPYTPLSRYFRWDLRSISSLKN